MPNLDSIQPDPNYRPMPPRVVVTSVRPQTVDLLGKNPRQRKGPGVFKTILIVMVVLILGLGAAAALKANGISSKIFVGKKTSFFEKVVELIRGSSGGGPLIGEDVGQINILLLGIGGEGHDGPYLTDTMILAQIRPNTGEVVLTSIPRDYWTEMPDNGGFAKINAAFSNGYVPNHDWAQGGDYAMQAVEKISGLNIPYFAEIDFSGFQKAIDQVGGIDVTVDRDFTDYQYPDSGTGYLPPQVFTAGPQHMDGNRALIFARSRHAAGLEGSDFARSQRQQKIIEAFKSKVLSLNLISNAGTINNLLNTFADHFHTNLGPGDIYRLYGLIKSKNISQISSLSLDPDTGLICAEIEAQTGAYILTPCAGKSEEDVVNFFKNAFALGKLAQEKSIVWLADSTGNQQAYDTAFRKLTDAGLVVYALSYTKDNLPQTIVYQANPKPATAEFIKNVLGASDATLPPPGVKPDTGKVDVIVVLGKNAPVEAEPVPYIPPPARQPTTSTSSAVSVKTATSAPATLSSAKPGKK